jgi:hypothetical protein
VIVSGLPIVSKAIFNVPDVEAFGIEPYRFNIVDNCVECELDVTIKHRSIEINKDIQRCHG